MLCPLRKGRSQSVIFFPLRTSRPSLFPLVGTAKVGTFSETAKSFLKYFLVAFFGGRQIVLCTVLLPFFLPLCQWPCGRPSLAEWCKDRDKIPSLPRGRAKYFSAKGITRCSIAR